MAETLSEMHPGSITQPPENHRFWTYFKGKTLSFVSLDTERSITFKKSGGATMIDAKGEHPGFCSVK